MWRRSATRRLNQSKVSPTISCSALRASGLVGWNGLGSALSGADLISSTCTPRLVMSFERSGYGNSAPIATTARIAPRMPSTRQKDSLRRSRLRSAISSASIGIARILEKDASPRGGGTLGAACLRGKRSEQPLLRGWLRRLGREALSLLDRLLDRADHVEGRLREVVVLALDEALEALDGVLERDELAGR